MSDITLVYTVSVYVEVSPDESEPVWRVTIADESAELAPMTRQLDINEGRDYSVSVADINRAIEVAENFDWPAWEFGY